MSSYTRIIPRAKTKKRVVAEENEELLMETRGADNDRERDEGMSEIVTCSS